MLRSFVPVRLRKGGSGIGDCFINWYCYYLLTAVYYWTKVFQAQPETITKYEHNVECAPRNYSEIYI